MLELRIGELRQLFNAMDPAPFRERDLDPNAETYIVEWARETRPGQPLRLVVHLGREAAPAGHEPMLRDAVDGYFRQRAESTRRELRQLFRVGRVSLLIGLAFLAGAIVIGEFVAGLVDKARLRRDHQGELRHRRLGRAVAAARDLPVRLVADPRAGAPLRAPGRNGRARARRGAGHGGGAEPRREHERGGPARSRHPNRGGAKDWRAPARSSRSGWC